MFVLQLNPMEHRAESVQPVARAETEAALLQFMQREMVEPYTTNEYGCHWHKCFRQGGPLEWYNHPGPHMEPWINVPAIVSIGTRDEWMQRAGNRYDEMLTTIPAV